MPARMLSSAPNRGDLALGGIPELASPNYRRMYTDLAALLADSDSRWSNGQNIRAGR